MDEDNNEFKEFEDDIKTDVKEEIKEDVLKEIKKPKKIQPQFRRPSISINWWIITTVLFLILFAAATFTGGFSSITGMSAVSAGEKSINFLNTQLLPPGMEATLISTDSLSGVYKVVLDVDGEQYDSYVTKDGKLFFISAIELSDIEPAAPAGDTNETQEPAAAPSAFNATDAETPKVQLFVMAFCPFGQQAENNIASVIDLFGDSIVFEPHFIVRVDNGTVSSLHGSKEANEDMRQACIWKYYPENWWEYALYVNENIPLDNIDEKWTEAAEAAGLDVESIEKCFEEEGLDLLTAEDELTTELGITGSPTLLINGEKYNGERTPDAYKQAICSGFEEQPDVCSEILETEGSSSTGSC